MRIEPPDAAAVADLVTALYEESQWAAVQAPEVGRWLVSQGVFAEPLN